MQKLAMALGSTMSEGTTFLVVKLFTDIYLNNNKKEKGTDKPFVKTIQLHDIKLSRA